MPWISARTFIASGATFYYLLVGRPPFESANVAQKLMMHQFKNPRPVQEFRKDVPAEILAILQKMMAKDVEKRYRVPGEIADALAPFTEIAIGPPPDAEMPHLSPAASGVTAGSDATDTTVFKNQDTPLAHARTLPSSGSGSGKKSAAAVITAPMASAKASTSSGRGLAAVAPAAQATPATAAKSAPKIEAEQVPWQDEAAPDPAADADTDLASNRKLEPPKSNSTMVLVLVGLIAVCALILTGTLGVLVWIFYPRPAPPPVVTGPTKLEVSKDPARPAAYRSVQQALRNAKLNSTIELWDAIYEENIVVDPTKGYTSVTLQAAPGKEVVWRAAKNQSDTPIIHLAKASDFKLKGKGIVLDGTLDNVRRVNDLVLINSDCTGLIVEDLQCKSFGQTAVKIMNSTGSTEFPIKLVRLTTITEKNEKPRAAIYFDANPKVVPAHNSNISIVDCAFQGLDPAKAIQFKDAAVLDKSVTWPGR